MTHTIRDRSGRRLGSIESQSDGSEVARNEAGRKLGHYDESSDVTYDVNGRRVGIGNLLSSLITESDD